MKCCNLKPEFYKSLIDCDIYKCKECGSYLADHEYIQGHDVWTSKGVTDEFLSALRTRRMEQAEEILDHLHPSGSVLDYACGQGAMTDELNKQGFLVVGCDIVGDNFRIESWQTLQGFQTVMLLDILEHNYDPKGFIKSFGADEFIVKVPIVDSIFYLARILSFLGSDYLLCKLFIVGDICPHVTYFSQKGLIKLFNDLGYTLHKSIKIKEVGTELPQRIRGNFPFKSVLSIIPILFPFLFTSRVYHFKRISS